VDVERIETTDVNHHSPVKYPFIKTTSFLQIFYHFFIKNVTNVTDLEPAMWQCDSEEVRS
jgi:hypothetical protein